MGGSVFSHIDIYNERDTPSGTIAAEDVRFEVSDGSVDMALLTSVFTHMYSEEIRRYLAEFGRVLRPGGRALTTWFALDESWARLDAAGSPHASMPNAIGENSRYRNPEDPLHLGYRPSWIRSSVKIAAMRIYATRLGRWCGREAAMGFQNSFVLQKPA